MGWHFIWDIENIIRQICLVIVSQFLGLFFTNKVDIVLDHTEEDSYKQKSSDNGLDSFLIRASLLFFQFLCFIFLIIIVDWLVIVKVPIERCLNVLKEHDSSFELQEHLDAPNELTTPLRPFI